MSQWLVVLTGCIYLAVAVEQYLKGSLGTAIMFAGYAIGNVGIYLQVK